MIQVHGNELWRGGQKIGFVQGNKIFSHNPDGSFKEAGYVSDNHVYNAHDNRKMAYLEGDYVYDALKPANKVRIEDNHQHVQGGEISDAHRAAVRMLLGD